MATITFQVQANHQIAVDMLKNPHPKQARVVKEDVVSLDRLENMFTMDSRSPGLSAMLKRQTLKHRQKAVPTLINHSTYTSEIAELAKSLYTSRRRYGWSYG